MTDSKTLSAQEARLQVLQLAQECLEMADPEVLESFQANFGFSAQAAFDVPSDELDEAILASALGLRVHEVQCLQFMDLKFAPLALDGVRVDGIHGYYKDSPGRGVTLYKLDRSPEAYIVSNPQQGRFIVSAFSPDGPGGAVRYMYSTSTLTERWLGIEGTGLLDLDSAVRDMSFVVEVVCVQEQHEVAPVFELPKSQIQLSQGAETHSCVPGM